MFYRVKMASSTEKLEVVFLTTIANGRKYTLEMRAIEKKGNHDWPALLTMADGMSFGGDKKPLIRCRRQSQTRLRQKKPSRPRMPKRNRQRISKLNLAVNSARP